MRILVCTLAGLALAPATAGAFRIDRLDLLPRTTLTAGCASRTVDVPVSGFVNVRLDGSPTGPDWDLTVADAVSGRTLGRSAAFGARELVSVPVDPGQHLRVRACGGGEAPGLSVTESVVDGAVPAPERQRLVAIRFRGRRDLDRLLALGIDLNETARGHSVFAVLHGAADASRLRRAGFRYRVTVPDLAAADAAALRDTASPRVALPSGRTTYRQLADYQADLKKLVDENPGLVRAVTLPKLSVQGRPIQGIEIAKDVNATGDGRPVHVEMGLHHVREWSSGEVVVEYALDLVNGFKAGDARITQIVDGSRTFLFPVINPDGLVATFEAGGYVAGIDDNSDGGAASLALAASGTGSYRRKNCRDSSGGTDTPCALANGVDLNRNYGAFWGGPGNSDNPQMQTFRGPAPYSEPEAQAVREWSSAHQVMVLNSNHNFAADVLYQPGFNDSDEPGLSKTATVPYKDQMVKVATDMAAAAGYVAMVSYELYDVTGATEDWNYFTQGAFGYTTEIGWDNFHPDYQDAVIDQYTGTRDGDLNKADSSRKPAKGLREALLIAGEAAMNPAYHAILRGTAPAGRLLRIAKDVKTTTSKIITNTDTAPVEGEAMLLDDHLESTLTVPAAGSYEWHVNPSTRPLTLLAGRTEAWTLTCEDGAGTVLERRQVVVGIGETSVQNLACDGTAPAPGAPASTTPGTAGTAGTPPAVVPTVLRASKLRRTKAGRAQVTLRLTGPGPVRTIVATLRDGARRVVARGTRASLRSSGRVTLTPRRRLRAGRRYTLTVTARAPSGVTVRATLRARLAR